MRRHPAAAAAVNARKRDASKQEIEGQLTTMMASSGALACGGRPTPAGADDDVGLGAAAAPDAADAGAEAPPPPPPATAPAASGVAVPDMTRMPACETVIRVGWRTAKLATVLTSRASTLLVRAICVEHKEEVTELSDAHNRRNAEVTYCA